jgi:acyl carrier protein
MDKLQQVFRDVFDAPDLTLRRDMAAGDVEGWDSLTHINLLVAVEKEFGVKFSLGEVRALKNVGDLEDLLERKAK